MDLRHNTMVEEPPDGNKKAIFFDLPATKQKRAVKRDKNYNKKEDTGSGENKKRNSSKNRRKKDDKNHGKYKNKTKKQGEEKQA